MFVPDLFPQGVPEICPALFTHTLSVEQPRHLHGGHVVPLHSSVVGIKMIDFGQHMIETSSNPRIMFFKAKVTITRIWCWRGQH